MWLKTDRNGFSQCWTDWCRETEMPTITKIPIYSKHTWEDRLGLWDTSEMSLLHKELFIRWAITSLFTADKRQHYVYTSSSEMITQQQDWVIPHKFFISQQKKRTKTKFKYPFNNWKHQSLLKHLSCMFCVLYFFPFSYELSKKIHI